MAEQPGRVEGSPDYEYDLAHEVTAPPAASSRVQERRPSYVATQTPIDDVGGDYGYDLAHDVPRLPG